jgi:uncharacterized protein YndB with AHSA1/START domain
MAELVIVEEIHAPPEKTWEALIDSAHQSEWMIATRVRGVGSDGNGLGAHRDAFTGVGPIGFLDTLVITQWEPPRRCVVKHTGTVVRGAGAFEVQALPDGRSRVILTEWVELPLGVLGQVGWLLARPIARLFFRASLKRMARDLA